MSLPQQPNRYSPWMSIVNIGKRLMQMCTSNLPNKLFAQNDSLTSDLVNISGQDEYGNSPDEAFNGENYDYDEVGEDAAAEEGECDGFQDDNSGEDNSDDANGDGKDEDESDIEDDENIESEEESDDEELIFTIEITNVVNPIPFEEVVAEKIAENQEKIDNEVPQGQQLLVNALPEDMQEPIFNESPANIEHPLPEEQQMVINEEDSQIEQQESDVDVILFSDRFTGDENDSFPDDNDDVRSDNCIMWETMTNRNEGESHDEELIFTIETTNFVKPIPFEEVVAEEIAENQENIDNEVPQGQQLLVFVLPEDMQEPMFNESPANIEQPLPEEQQMFINEEDLQIEQQESDVDVNLFSDRSTGDENDSFPDDNDDSRSDNYMIWETMTNRNEGGSNDEELIFTIETTNFVKPIPSEEVVAEEIAENQEEIDNEMPQGQQLLVNALPEDMQEPMFNESPANVEQPLPEEHQAVVNEEGSQMEEQESDVDVVLFSDRSTGDENDSFPDDDDISSDNYMIWETTTNRHESQGDEGNSFN